MNRILSSVLDFVVIPAAATAAAVALGTLMPQKAAAHEPKPVVWMLIVYPYKTGSMQKIPMASMEQCEKARAPVGGKYLSNIRLNTLCVEGAL